ncbi:MAG TPA: beta-ketoacyl-ACP synthase II [Polyangiaceae bacterium]|nr:beta-ketoacyl-ACP synthase II [Polyangiaceae bacterium]
MTTAYETGKRRRVFVTGIGLVTAFGQSVPDVWASLLAGRSGISEIERFPTAGFPVRIGGEVKAFDPDAFIAKKDSRLMDRFIQFGVAASWSALEDAGLNGGQLRGSDRAGVIIGSGVGGMNTVEEQSLQLHQKGLRNVSPFYIPMMLINMVAAHVSIAGELRGPTSAVATACAAGANAIGDSLRLIQRGDADVMVCGASEALYPLSLAGFCRSRALATEFSAPARASRPFDARRGGFVLAEGAAVIVLEAEDHALGRGARAYAELCGYGQASDAFNITMPHPEGTGAALSMTKALADAGIGADAVDYINAHGTATRLGDPSETRAIKAAFGSAAPQIPISSIKSMTGHLLGASGALEAAVSALTVWSGKIPPTINLEEPDPECDLDYVPGCARQRAVRHALSNTFAFGGHNVGLVFGQVEPVLRRAT